MRSTNPKPGGAWGGACVLGLGSDAQQRLSVIPFEKGIINKPVSI